MIILKVSVCLDDRRGFRNNFNRGRREWDHRGYGRKDRLPATTKSGRIIKGRGVFVSNVLLQPRTFLIHIRII